MKKNKAEQHVIQRGQGKPLFAFAQGPERSEGVIHVSVGRSAFWALRMSAET